MAQDIIILNEISETIPVRERRTDATVKEMLPAKLVLVLQALMQLCFWVFVLTLLYDIYAVAGGAIASYPFLDRYQQFHMTGNLEAAGKIMAVTGIYLVLYTLMSAYELRDRFFGMMVVFGLFHFGLPFLFLNVLGLVNNAAAYQVVKYADIVAGMCLASAGFRLFMAIIGFMRHGIGGAMAKIDAQRSKMPDSRSRSESNKRPFYRLISHCWELPYCREYLLKVCPAWQRKKTCWKHGSGCFCDPGMMDRLIQIEMAPGPGRSHSPVVSIPKGSKKCHTCPIYLAHEENKYRTLSPMIPVAGLLLLVLGWEWLVQEYIIVARALGGIIGAIAIGPVHSLNTEWMNTMTDSFVMYTLIFCGVLVLTGYALQLAEWAILEKKL